MKIKVEAEKCPKCKHVWATRVEKPRLCPKCKKRLAKPNKKPSSFPDGSWSEAATAQYAEEKSQGISD